MRARTVTVLSAVGAFVIWVGCLAVAGTFFNDWPTRGQFGDTFGAANSLFTGLAFVALIATLLLQRQDLELQRDELRLQREELHGSRMALSQQANSQRLQVLASVTRTRVSALETQVEALKMESERFIHSARDKQIDEIRAIGSQIQKLADALEERLREADAQA